MTACLPIKFVLEKVVLVPSKNCVTLILSKIDEVESNRIANFNKYRLKIIIEKSFD